MLLINVDGLTISERIHISLSKLSVTVFKIKQTLVIHTKYICRVIKYNYIDSCGINLTIRKLDNFYKNSFLARLKIITFYKL